VINLFIEYLTIANLRGRILRWTGRSLIPVSFYNVFSTAQFKEHQNENWLKQVQKEVVVTYLKVSSHHLSKKLRKATKHLRIAGLHIMLWIISFMVPVGRFLRNFNNAALSCMEKWQIHDIVTHQNETRHQNLGWTVGHNVHILPSLFSLCTLSETLSPVAFLKEIQLRMAWKPVDKVKVKVKLPLCFNALTEHHAWRRIGGVEV